MLQISSNQLQPNSLTSLLEAYGSYLDVAPRTAEAYMKNLRRFAQWISERGITEPTRGDVIAYRDELRATLKPSTIQAYISAVRLFFEWTEVEGYYPNIAKRIKSAKVDKGQKKDYLTASQVQHLLASIDTSTGTGARDYALIALMVTGGLRDIEAHRANVEDLQPQGGHTVLYLQGKGRDEKTEFVKIAPEVEQALRAYLSKRSDHSPEAPLFTSTSNRSQGGRLSTRSISGTIKGRMLAIGLDSDRLTAHSLRHTSVTLALLADIPLEEVQQHARHRNIATTQTYAHHLEVQSNRSAQAVAGAIFTK